MRVNISYSVELDTVPDKVVEFIEDCSSQLSDYDVCLESVGASIRDGKYAQALTEMARFRDVLASIDYRLNDCMTIMSGYSKVLADQALPQEEEEQVPSEKLEKFQKELERLRETQNEQSETSAG